MSASDFQEIVEDGCPTYSQTDSLVALICKSVFFAACRTKSTGSICCIRANRVSNETASGPQVAMAATAAPLTSRFGLSIKAA